MSARTSRPRTVFVAAQPYVRSYEYITKEMARKQFVGQGNDDFMSVLEQNPLPASVDFRVRSEYANADSLNKIKADFAQNIAVDEVKYNKKLVSNVDDWIRKTSLILLIVTLAISIAVIILIDNTIRLSMFSNRFLIKTMQMVGATRWFIARPMNRKAIMHGAISGVIAIAAIIGIIFAFETWLPWIRALRDNMLLGMMFGVMILLGICISFISTHRSVVKYLKMKLDDLY
jgi:cell division transport system permease protein